ncbi:MAG: cupin [Elusimicrobiota bacterium]|jgi:mannose-6-phosphate isomerase-like protein (cupin superfamily)
MARYIEKPSVVEAAGNKPKIIEEYIGRVNTGTTPISVARMVSPAGWEEPAQEPRFAEYTIVLKGMLKVETKKGTYEVRGGQAVMLGPDEWVRYSSPEKDGAEYVSICLPAFSYETVRRAN